MRFQETKLKGAFIIDIDRIEDDRGFFGRSWCKREFEENGLKSDIVQANVSYNRKKGTLRGLHYQLSPYEEAKIIRCTSGAIYDVIVDIRQESETYKQWLGVELTKENLRMVYVPEGCAHGFFTLAHHSSVLYMVTQYYAPGSEAGVLYNDPAFNILWPDKPSVVSIKDRSHKLFDERVFLPNVNQN